MSVKFKFSSICFYISSKEYQLDLETCKKVVLSYGPKQKKDFKQENEVCFSPRTIQHFFYNPFSWVSVVKLKVDKTSIFYQIQYPIPIVTIALLIFFSLIYCPPWLSLALLLKLIWHVSYISICQRAIFNKMLKSKEGDISLKDAKQSVKSNV